VLLALLTKITRAGPIPLVTTGTCTVDSCQASGRQHLQLINERQQAQPPSQQQQHLYLDQLLQQTPPQHLQTGGAQRALRLSDNDAPPVATCAQGNCGNIQPVVGTAFAQQHQHQSTATGGDGVTVQSAQGQQASTAAGMSAVSVVSAPASRCTPWGPGPGLACLNVATGQWEKVRWFSSWAYDADWLKKIHDSLKHGKLVRIQDALTTQAAEAIYQEIWDSHGSPGWQLDIKYAPDIQFHRQIFNCQAGGEPACPPILHAFHTFLENEKDYWGRLVRSNISFWQKTAWVTRYQYGDYLSPHSDYTHQRDLAFNLALSKNWTQSWGGSFWWLKENAQEYASGFNTLFLFLPTGLTNHMVSTVSKEGDSHRRFSINGWFVGNEDSFGMLGDATL